MPSHIRNFALFLLPTAALWLGACGGTKVVVVPNPATPAPSAAFATPSRSAFVSVIPAMPATPSETASISPGPDYVWVAGYYDWRSGRYVWVPGSWVKAPQTSSVWVPSHWEPSAGGYSWVEGHWN